MIVPDSKRDQSMLVPLQAYSGVYSAEQELATVQKTYNTHESAAEDARQAIDRTKDTAAALQQDQSRLQQVRLPPGPAF